MTLKDYELIAGAIAEERRAHSAPSRFGVDSTADAVASALARDNPRFDRERFLKACGYNDT